MTNPELAEQIVDALAECSAIPHQTLDNAREDVIAIVSAVLDKNTVGIGK